MVAEGPDGEVGLPGATLSANAGIGDWRIDDDAYHHWIGLTEAPALQALLTSSSSVRASDEGPLISIILPVFDTPENLLREALDSVCGQHYPRWQLCVVDDASAAPHVRPVLAEYAGGESRIKVLTRTQNGGISRASNDALAMVAGEYVALMDHDDVLAPHALLLVAMTIVENPGTALLYSDSDELDDGGKRCNPFFKPEFNYDLLLGQNYLNHLTVYSADLLDELTGFRTQFDASQDYDLALRAVERLAPEAIQHIPHVLYHWRVVASSVARSNLGHACSVARTAVAQHLARTGQDATVAPADRAKIFNRILRQPLLPEPGMTALVYGDDPGQVDAALRQLRRAADDPSLTIVGVTLPAGTADAGLYLNARGAEVATEFMCLLHAAVRLEQSDFFSVLATHLARPGVAAAAGMMLSPQAGLACGALLTGIGPLGIASCCQGAALDSKGYFARLCLEQTATVAHAAALAVRSASFRAVDGVSAGLAHPLLMGADLCLKLAQRGETLVWTPYARVLCPAGMLDPEAELPALGAQLQRFDAIWQGKPGVDPLYNPNLSRRSGRFRLAESPERGGSITL